MELRHCLQAAAEASLGKLRPPLLPLLGSRHFPPDQKSLQSAHFCHHTLSVWAAALAAPRYMAVGGLATMGPNHRRGHCKTERHCKTSISKTGWFI
jgi:hypothetical protein